jgi:hypothetical protein
MPRMRAPYPAEFRERIVELVPKFISYSDKLLMRQ